MTTPEASVSTPALARKDDIFDPHLHRKVANPISYGETMTHMVKGTIGAGMLAIPMAYSRMGLVCGFFLGIFLGVIATLGIQILILGQYEICKQEKVGYLTFSESMKLAVLRGPKGMRWSATAFAISVDVLLIVWQIGVCAVYLVFVSENINQFLMFIGYPGYSLRILICFLYPPLVVVGMIKDLKLLAPLSTMSNCCNLFGVVLVFFYLIEDDLEMKPESFLIKSIIDIPIFIGTVLFAMEAVGVVLALEYNMANPKQFLGLNGVFPVGMFFINIGYVVLGIFGFLKYGDKIQASITFNLPKNEKKAQAAKLVFAISIFTSFPLQNYVAWQIILGILEKKHPQNRRIIDLMTRVLCTTIPFMMAIAAPTLGPFIELMGSLCLPTLAMMFPAIQDICVYYPDRLGAFRWKLWSDLVIVVLSIIFCLCGCCSSILEMKAMLLEQYLAAQ